MMRVTESSRLLAITLILAVANDESLNEEGDDANDHKAYRHSRLCSFIHNSTIVIQPSTFTSKPRTVDPPHSFHRKPTFRSYTTTKTIPPCSCVCHHLPWLPTTGFGPYWGLHMANYTLPSPEYELGTTLKYLWHRMFKLSPT